MSLILTLQRVNLLNGKWTFGKELSVNREYQLRRLGVCANGLVNM
jgi:hypothetical protein